MNVFARLLRLLAPFSWRVALTVLLGVAMIACSAGLLGMAAYIISAAALRPLIVSLTLPVYIVRFAGVGRAASRYAERLTGHSLTFRLLARLRTRVYQRLAPLSPDQMRGRRSGDLLARLIADVDELQHLYLRVVGPFLVAGIVALLTAGVFAAFSPALAWTALASLAVAGVLVPLLARRLARETSAYPAARAELQAQIVDGIQGMQDVVAFGREREVRERIAARDAALAHLQRRASWASGAEQALNELVQAAALWGVLVLAIPLVAAHHIGGVYLAFLALVLLASFESVQPLAPALQSLGRTLSAGRRVFETLDAVPEVTDPQRPAPVAALDRRAAPSLSFERVSFAYALDGEAALRDITLRLPPGGRVAIVGPSGAGKSTLARLAARCHDPTAGAVRLDGVDIRRHALGDLRAAVRLNEQGAYLFNATIRGNLRLVRPDATDDDLMRALEVAQLGHFIGSLPEGLGTWVGEHGLRLSGGERQRLALARALLTDAPLLILDEPTANLDPATEVALLDAVDAHTCGRTLLLLTHRLVRMERIDEIVVLDGGRVVERGTHAALLAAGGLYRRMFDIQQDVFTLSAALD